MLEQDGCDPAVVRQLRLAPLGAVLDDFVSDMRTRGHAERTIGDYVREAGHLGRWMDGERLTVDTLNESALEAFLGQHAGAGRRAIRSGKPRPQTRAALRRLLATLQARHIVAAPSPPPISPVDGVVQQFLAHSTSCRGVGPATCREEGRHVRAFLTGRFPDQAIDSGMITAQDLRLFVAARAEQGQTKTAQCTASALRAFLRFLVLRGMCSRELVAAVPTVAHRGARLPRHLSGENA